jgi:serine phosphatase RsbU (regulator of sigma subunit)/anti-sigma regulatory factor (Ser/Thr protein kinase)
VQLTNHIITFWRMHRADVRSRAIDLGLVVVVIVSFMLAISVAFEQGSRAPDAVAYALGVLLGILVLFRRRWPLGVLVASLATLQVYYLANYPGMSPAVPLAVVLYTAAAAGHLRWSLAVVVWYGCIPLIFAASGVLGPQVLVLDQLLRDSAILVAIVLFGDAVRSHRALMAESAARLQRAEQDRQREAQELSAAQVIQQQLLPKELPSVPGWHIAAYYQPARAIGGDFYNFLALPDRHMALLVGDVTDKGIPAALVMAATHSILRSDAAAFESPGVALARANDRLYPDIPARMFVTCLYAVLDPVRGCLRYANAGHCLPYLTTAAGVTQLHATGMPLGALPDMQYEEHETVLAPGDSLLLYSDGLVEAHNPAGEMFGFPRLKQIVERSRGSQQLIDKCIAALRAFVGPDWEQEDDIMLVTLQRCAGWRTLAEFAIASKPGNERVAIDHVAGAVRGLGLAPRRLERLQTAVAEATMNAMEHGNQYRTAAPVRLRIAASAAALSVSITDEGNQPLQLDAQTPDLEAKLDHQQTARGWGLFLIKHMVDDMQVSVNEHHHTVTLIMRLDQRPNEGQS